MQVNWTGEDPAARMTASLYLAQLMLNSGRLGHVESPQITLERVEEDC